VQLGLSTSHNPLQLLQEKDQPASLAGLARAVLLQYGAPLFSHFKQFENELTRFNLAQVGAACV
jgi:hypothetical protein